PARDEQQEDGEEDPAGQAAEFLPSLDVPPPGFHLLAQYVLPRGQLLAGPGDHVLTLRRALPGLVLEQLLSLVDRLLFGLDRLSLGGEVRQPGGDLQRGHLQRPERRRVGTRR